MLVRLLLLLLVAHGIAPLRLSFHNWVSWVFRSLEPVETIVVKRSQKAPKWPVCIPRDAKNDQCGVRATFEHVNLYRHAF